MLVFVDLGPAERLGFFLNFEHFFKSFFFNGAVSFDPGNFRPFLQFASLLDNKKWFFFFQFYLSFHLLVISRGSRNFSRGGGGGHFFNPLLLVIMVLHFCIASGAKLTFASVLNKCDGNLVFCA